jgi:hypothetical protein
LVDAECAELASRTEGQRLLCFEIEILERRVSRYKIELGDFEIGTAEEKALEARVRRTKGEAAGAATAWEPQ